MKSKTISRLPGVASECTPNAFVFLLVPNPVPKREDPDSFKESAPSHRLIRPLTCNSARDNYISYQILPWAPRMTILLVLARPHESLLLMFPDVHANYPCNLRIRRASLNVADP